jgi:hypothetical protein
MAPIHLWQHRRGSFEYLLLKWLFDNGIANCNLTTGEDETAHPTTPLQGVLSPSANGGLHSRAGIARCFDEDVRFSNAEPPSDQIVQIDTSNNDLASTRPQRYRSSEDLLDLCQRFGLDQGKLTASISP